MDCGPLRNLDGLEPLREVLCDCHPNRRRSVLDLANGEDPVRSLENEIELEAALLLSFDPGSAPTEISDPVFTLSWLFLGGKAPGCAAALNANGDRFVDISDPVFLLSRLFLGGSAPAAPYPGCGPGELPEDETLGCATPPESCQ